MVLRVDNAAIVKEILDYNANPDPRPDSYGRTPLNTGVEKRYEETVKVLLESGVNVNTKDCEWPG